ncbi:hypothetical protein M9Y10_038201 [Tritrichomonas musculus]|uniref:HNH nuclease domain-containing protein n=1 Tax=Tritrichomonas musculus TaxID=1915356 RepID=A0ABR2K8L9_9EUKA
MTEQIVDFVPLKDYEDKYEILNQYPFIIRRKSDKYVIKENINNAGYPCVSLNAKKTPKHQIIAKQFIPNPKNLPQIDHINHDRTDYHLENLRWTNQSENMKNVSSRNGVEYEFIDNIPDEAIEITHYSTTIERKEFNEKEYYYYFDEKANKDIFYQRITDKLYREMYINRTKSGRELIMTRDKNRKKVLVYIHTFKYQYNID